VIVNEQEPFQVRAPSPNEVTPLLSLTPYVASAIGQIADGTLLQPYASDIVPPCVSL
jgi:hypothetical protein